MKMKLKDLTDIIYSTRNNITFVTIYSRNEGKDILSDSTIEYAIEEYGEREVKRIYPEDNTLIIIID